MSSGDDAPPPTMPAVHATRPISPDPTFEIELAAHLKATLGDEGVEALYGRFVMGRSAFDGMMRRVIWRALADAFGDGAVIAPGAQFRHLEHIRFGSGVFVGEGALIQGHALGRCRIGDRAWIGPQAFLDARALDLDPSVALGPGAKVLSAAHTGLPAEAAIMATDQVVGPVHLGEGCDIGVGAVVLPGCSVGEGALIGAGAVVTGDIPAGTVAAGVPARVIRSRSNPKG